jgi:hypothetical protein
VVPLPLPTISETIDPSAPSPFMPRRSVTRTYPSSSASAIGANEEGKKENKGVAAGAIVGGLFGCFAFIALILFAIRWYKRRSRSDKKALLRSSWFYGGDVDIPEEEDEQEVSHFFTFTESTLMYEENHTILAIWLPSTINVQKDRLSIIHVCQFIHWEP